MYKKNIRKNDNIIFLFSGFMLMLGLALGFFVLMHFILNLKITTNLIILSFCSFAFVFWFFFDILKYIHINKKYKTYYDSMNGKDILTGLPNIYSLTYKNKKLLSNDKNKYFISIGINKFRNINEVFGYKYADTLLLNIKNKLLTLTDVDKISKLNGDEFGLIYECSNEQELLKYIEKIKNIFSEVYCNGNTNITLSCRFGISKIENSDLMNAITRSAIALKESKVNNVLFTIYSCELNKNTKTEIALENEFLNAVNNNEIEVYFQPKIDTKTKKINGAESLARWFSKTENRYIPPNVFVKIAEEIGVIEKFGFLIFENSLIELKKWHNLGYTDLKISINISPKQLNDDLPYKLKLLADKYQILTNSIEIEVTETTLILDTKSSNNILKEIRDYGFTIAIDDFGTGYSSLSYLVNFPLDVVKIDKSFIDNLNYNNIEKDKIKLIISSIINLSPEKTRFKQGSIAL